MANINVSVAASNVSVTEVVSNVVITDPDNVIIGNVTTTQSVVSVSTSPTVVNVGTGPIPTPVSNAEIRAGVSATAPILYDQSTGVFSLDTNASFIGKTTDNLSEGSTNLYFTTARARQSISGSGDISYDANTGVISYTGTPGDITDVIAGAGLTGGGSSGNVTLNVGAGTGITVNVDNVSVDMTAFTTTDLAEGANLYYTTARANTAIDARVNKAYVEGLGVSYTSLSDKPTIPTHTSNLVNDSGFITSATANVISVNGKTGVVVLNTGDIAEGANLYFTTGRANIAIDARVNKAFVDALGVEYSSLANAPTNVSFFTNDAGYLVAANLASLTANVDSVNGKTGVVILNTDDISEGASNLYYSNARVNAFIQNNITTTDIDEGTNLYYTTARANTAIGAYQGNINTPGNVTAGNIITTGIHTNGGTSLVLNNNNSLVLRETIKGVATNVGNINGDGYGLIRGVGSFGVILSHSGTGELNSYFITTGNSIAGNNTITGVTINDINAGSPGAAGSLSNITQYYTISSILGGEDQYPFPPGTYVTSVDAANGTITFNNQAAISYNFAGSSTTLSPGAYDSGTGLVMCLLSQYAAGAGSSRTAVAGQTVFTPGSYGYPSTGPAPSNFVYSIDTANDYASGGINTNKLFARTKIEGVRTVFQAPRGIVVGNGDLTNRAENDILPSFGVNILWDGLTSPTTEYASNSPFTQLLLKQYSDNSSAAGAALNATSQGPRILFTTARGNKNQSYLSTYPRVNNELGRITWWGSTQALAAPSTTAPPAYINAVTNQDYVSHNGGTGLYFVASPHTDAARRGMFLSHHLGNTVITSSGSTSSGATSPITFAPMTTSTVTATAGNSIAMYNNIMAANNYQWASINYDNPTGFTGSRLSITNGASTVAGRNGNISLVLDRNDNGAGFGSKEWALKLQPGSNNLVLTEDDVVRTTFSGANITTSGNITAGNTIVTGVAFNTTNNVAPSSGQIVYNSDYGALQTGLNGSNVIINGQDMVAYVRNDESNTLVKGEVVYLYGATGDKASVKRAVNSGDTTSSKTLGVVKSDIAAGALGYIVTQGVVNGLDLSAYTAGDILWLGNVAGTFTKNKPVSPEHLVFVGVVEKANAGNGQIYINVQNGYELEELHDVLITNEAANDVIIRNSGNTLWVNQNFGTTVTNSNITLKQYQETKVDLGSTGGNITLNMANGSIFTMTATSNISNIALSNAGVGVSGTLIITQDGTGGKTLTTTSAWKFASGSKTLTTSANAIDIISFFTDGTTVYAALSKGYA